ncbi:uncharacterized protein BYT42DRAFT_585474 [Radiomyces spectabilis]|uniref:uncharacterized protein n=1 Tax=Radiomyces spectabilis TaxID=64574 RepID=UPI00221E53E4|nr:uncharacterized protein BYT42DRAFT_585474 [Radiomyces spectabilis]KAI8368147.1 hypothetical protein BYT42DRAFT_585474 [Radiomyces spectabilis]
MASKESKSSIKGDANVFVVLSNHHLSPPRFTRQYSLHLFYPIYYFWVLGAIPYFVFHSAFCLLWSLFFWFSCWYLSFKILLFRCFFFLFYYSMPSQLSSQHHHQHLPSLSSSISSCSSGTSTPQSLNFPRQSVNSQYYYYSIQQPCRQKSAPPQRKSQRYAELQRPHHPPQRSVSASSLGTPRSRQSSDWSPCCYTPNTTPTVLSNRYTVAIPTDISPLEKPMAHDTPSQQILIASTAIESSNPPASSALQEPPNTHLWWDESQLALELAEDDLMPKKKTTGKKGTTRRIKEKISCFMHSSSSSLSSSSSSASLSIHSKKSNRIARSLKKLANIISL